VGVLLELNCETDFVAKTPQFRELAHNLALHIANMSPRYVSREHVPAELVEAEKAVQRKRALDEGKPEAVADKIVAGRLDKFYQDIVLLDQEFILDDTKTVAQMIQQAIADLGENIQVGRFARFAIGESADGNGA